MIVKLLTDYHLEFLILKGDCRGSAESTLVKMSNCWKSHACSSNSIPLTLTFWYNMSLGGDVAHVRNVSGVNDSQDWFQIGHNARKPFFRVSDPVKLRTACSATETCSKNEISLEASLDMILFSKRITKVTAWMCRLVCPFVFPKPRRQVFWLKV